MGFSHLLIQFYNREINAQVIVNQRERIKAICVICRLDAWITLLDLTIHYNSNYKLLCLL